MDPPVMPLASVAAMCALGSGGLYLALAAEPGHRRFLYFRAAGVILGVAALVWMGLALSRTLRINDASRLDSTWSQTGFWCLAGIALTGGATATIARRRLVSCAALAAVSLAVVGLQMQADAGILAAATGFIALATATIAFAANRAQSRMEHLAEPVDRSACREPLLACVAGGLLSAGLIAAVHAAWTYEINRTTAVVRNEESTGRRYAAVPATARIRALAERASGEMGVSDDAAVARPEILPATLVPALAGLGLVMAAGAAGFLRRR